MQTGTLTDIVAGTVDWFGRSGVLVVLDVAVVVGGIVIEEIGPETQNIMPQWELLW
jgi:hypothetical protein